MPPEDSKNAIEPAKLGFYTVCALLTGLSVAAGPFLRRYGGAPYVASAPAARAAIRSWLRQYRHTPTTNRFTDLGSGSGELVLEAAKAGFQARGLELNRWLVLWCQLRAYRLPAEVRRRVEFRRQDFWGSQLSDEDVVVVFGVPDMMQRVGELVENQCKNECVVCCNTFPIPGWTAMRQTGGVYFYKVGDQRKRNEALLRDSETGLANAAGVAE